MMYLFEASIISGILYVAFQLLYKSSGHHLLNRWYLLSALLLSVVLPLFHIPLFPRYVQLRPILKKGVAYSSTSAELSSGIEGVWILYGLGVLGMLTVLLIRLLRLRQVIQRGEHFKKEGHTIVYTEADIPVSSFGYYLIIPYKRKGQMTHFELLHEQAHINQKHSVDIIVLQFYQLVFWFNPFVYLYQKRLVEIHEYLADQTTINVVGIKAYRHFLLQQLEQKRQNTLVHNFYSLFKQRIDMMHNTLVKSKFNYFWIAPMLVALLVFFSCESYDVVVKSNEEVVELTSSTVDTVITFDPATGKETVQIVERNKGASSPDIIVEEKIDTVFVFDPETGEENVHIIKSPSNDKIIQEIDTIITFDPATKKETIEVRKVVKEKSKKKKQ